MKLSFGLFILGFGSAGCASIEAGNGELLINEAPSQDMEFSGQTLLIPLNGRRMVGSIGGTQIDIVFDTGAPGAGLKKTFADDRNLPYLAGRETVTVLPAFNIRYPKRMAVLDELTLGDATFRNITVSIGEPSEADTAILEAQGLASDMIFGLDLFRPHFATATFDYDAGSVSFGREGDASDLLDAELTEDGKYIVEVSVGGKPARMLIDTGSKSNTVSPAYAESVPCFGYREFVRSWGAFSERLLPLTLTGDVTERRWVEVRDFATDEALNIIGVLGEVNGGQLVLNLSKVRYRWDWVAEENMNYPYEPTRQTETCPPL
ncbi:MAG: aspartyl protease family protein [Litorimonas sp.]